MPPAVTINDMRERAKAAMSGSPCGRTLVDAADARSSRISNPFSSKVEESFSLGKRKEHPEGYGAEESVPQEEFLGRKKKRTLWDGNLSQTSATDLAPPRTPSRQLSGPSPSTLPQSNGSTISAPETPPRRSDEPPLTPIKYDSPSVTLRETPPRRSDASPPPPSTLPRSNSLIAIPPETLPRRSDEPPLTPIKSDKPSIAAPEAPPRRSDASPVPPPTPIPTSALLPSTTSSADKPSAFPEHNWPKDIRYPELCGHPIHPACADSYNTVNCPVCLVETAMNNVKIPQNFIFRHGGISIWKENLHITKNHDLHYMMVAGGPQKGQPVRRNADGTDVSYRHHKTMLLNLVIELRLLSKMEQQWEAKQSLANTTLVFERNRVRKQWSATGALKQYKDIADDGFFGRLEKDSAMFHRKRGRDWEIVADPGYPDYPPDIGDVKENRRFKDLTTEQTDFILKSEIPQPQETDVPDLPPRRKRRRAGAGVTFNPDVYVRTDADVDVLRKQHTSLSEGFLEDKPAPRKPGPSILRTAALKIDPTPPRPHNVIPLNGDGRPRGPNEGHMYRLSRGYKLGKWATSQGMEKINTSGYRRDMQTHLDYGEKLQQEAAIMDNEEKFAELTSPLADTQMNNAPSNDTPVPSPRPQQKSEAVGTVPVPSLTGKLVQAGVFRFFGFVTAMSIFG
jgi:hypothetical protein